MKRLLALPTTQYAAVAFGLALLGFILLDMNRAPAEAANGQVTIESDVSLTAEGDRNGNGDIDAGDTVLLTFTIINGGDAEYPFATLHTGLQSELLHRFWNVQGATGINTDGDSLTFPNLWIAPKARKVVSVESTVDYAIPADTAFAIAPVLVDKTGQAIPSPKELKRIEKKIKKGKIPVSSMIKRGEKLENSDGSTAISSDPAVSSASSEAISSEAAQPRAPVSSDSSSSDAAAASSSL